MTSNGYDLRLGSLSLLANDLGSYKFAALGNEFTLGNPVAQVSQTISSMLRDGDLTTTTRFGNRVASFLVEITAQDAGGLAAGMAALDAELDKPNTMTWQVPYGPDTIFEVVRSTSDWMFDDLVEVRQIKRTMRVEVECLPFGHDEDELVINWTGPGVEESTASTTGWNVIGGGAIEVSGGHIQKTTTGSSLTLSRSVLLNEYVWIKIEGQFGSSSLLSSVSVDGVSIPDAEVRAEKLAGHHFYTVPTGSWRGQTATFQFTFAGDSAQSNRAILEEFWTVGYPNKTPVVATVQPLGIGVIEPGGSARAGFTATFTVPTGGAWLFTCPDPNASLRERGAAEMQWTYETIVDPPDNYQIVTTPTEVQPLALYPNGVWPQTTFGTKSYGFPTSIVPDDSAVTYFNTTGAKTVVSATAALGEGYHADAIAHEEHVLHPGRSGFALLDQDGAPIACTITYKRHWKHLAA